MNTAEEKTVNNKNKAQAATNRNQEVRKSDIRYWLTRIGIGFLILLLIAGGLFVGQALRLFYEPQMIRYKLETFSVALPVRPTKEETSGIPPFSNRRMIKYQVTAAPESEYQILVLERGESAGREETAAGSSKADVIRAGASPDDTEMQQWAESTIGVLCADDKHEISKGCLQPGSRLTNWSVTTVDGIHIRGNLKRDKKGNLIQLLATGTSEEEARNFFESFRLE